MLRILQAISDDQLRRFLSVFTPRSRIRRRTPRTVNPPLTLAVMPCLELTIRWKRLIEWGMESVDGMIVLNLSSVQPNPLQDTLNNA